ncbi:MAG: hypothetical protein EPO36_04885 [Chloroflexota bacterium]|nr:MAG: hypothetical protein EPO36_04885 [Chloroflexota bacterium]
MPVPTVRRRRSAIVGFLVTLATLAAPATVAAHPLGNFTINHYAALRVGETSIALDVVIDFAEIPAFQERIRIDADGDGDVGDAEADAAREPACLALRPSLELRVDDAPIDLRLEGAGLSFPAGAGGVPTMRLVCELVATLPSPLPAGSVVRFGDASYAERIGWREIVVIGDGLTIGGLEDGSAPTSADVSARLTGYPESLLAQPLDIRSVGFTVTPGGPTAEPFAARDAAPVANVPDPGSGSATPDASAPPAGPLATPGPTPGSAAVPGGVGGEIPDLFRVADLTPLVALGSILLAMALGAGHALTPGHGKTLMAAYLVGTRGTIRHAAGLGLAVTVSHTLGILVLAVLVTGAESALPADVVIRTVPVVAAAGFVAIGAWMVVAEGRRRRRRAHLAGALLRAHDEEHARMHAAELGHELGREHDHGHGHGHGHAQEHSHGGLRHSHLPADDRTISWRSLFALGLAGGIIPSTNALIILLGTIVAGRAPFGIVLVIAFGLGMALVLGGVGAVMVLARERLERLPSTSRLGPWAAQAPLAASIAVLGIGLWLTAQALTGSPIL